jgi:hypothetical protein
MYALEEYGKAIILKKYMEKAKGPLYTKPQAVFDYGSHNIKIEEGIKQLPEQCKIVAPFVEIRVNTSTETKVFQLMNGKEVLVPAGTTGLFQSSSDPLKRFIESDYKTRCFYMDYDPNDNEERNNLFGDKTIMKKNIELFKGEIEKFSFV